MKKLIKKVNIEANSKLFKAYDSLGKLIKAIAIRDISESSLRIIDEHIASVNTSKELDNKFVKLVNKARCEIIGHMEREYKLVVKNHYRNMWMALGMSMFGVPLGVVFGFSIGNMGFLGIGLPIGMAIGLAIGTKLDEKAKKEGNVLDIECM